MRTIGLVAAAAAGMIAPLAIAMPALADAQSPVLGGVTSIVDGDNGDNGPDKDDNGDNHDDNGDNHDDNGDNHDGNGPYNHDDNRDNHGDNRDDHGDNRDDHGDNRDDHGDNRDDHGDYNGPYLSAYASSSKASGDVSFIVDVNDAGEFETYVLESPSLDAGCDFSSITGATAESDRFGHLNVSGDADNCIPGKYKIAVSQTGGHEETHYVDVHVD